MAITWRGSIALRGDFSSTKGRASRVDLQEKIGFFARGSPPGRLPRRLFSPGERALVRRRGGTWRPGAPPLDPALRVARAALFLLPFSFSFSFLVIFFLSCFSFPFFFFLFPPFFPPSEPRAPHILATAQRACFCWSGDRPVIIKTRGPQLKISNLAPDLMWA